MLRTLLKITLRTLIRQKRFAITNLIGLSIGLTACIFLFHYVLHQSSYDRGFPKYKQIVRIPMTWNFGETSVPTGSATSALAVDLKELFPEVINFVRFSGRGSVVLQIEEQLFEEQYFTYVDSSFFSIFDVDLLQGNAATALIEPQSIVLTRSSARQLFGNEWGQSNILGKQVLIDNKENYQITGVMEDLPSTSHIEVNVLASFSSLSDFKKPNWDNSRFPTYLLLDKHHATELRETENRFQEAFNQKYQEQVDMISIHVEAIDDVYLRSEFNNHLGKQSDEKYLYILSAVGLLILLMACINYVNMTTAHALNRAKEVGIKKVSGAYRIDLFWQFIFESAFLIMISFMIAIMVVFALKDWFQNITGFTMSWEVFLASKFMFGLLMLFFLLSLVAGSYPALILSRFQPVKVLKGKFSYSGQGTFLRRTLVVVQFAISMFLLAFTYTIFQQMELVQSKNLGYEKEHTLIVPIDSYIIEKEAYLRSKIMNLSIADGVTFASNPPIDIAPITSVRQLDITKERQLISYLMTDRHYLETFSLPMVEGKGFDEISYPDSSLVFVINEAATKFFGWDQKSAIGKKLQIWGDSEGEVIGVVKNFNFQSLRRQIEPLLMVSRKQPLSFRNKMMVKVKKEADIRNAIHQLTSLWKEEVPHYPFNFTFMDEEYQALYNAETRLNKLFIGFSMLALVIALLGLTGLAAFTTSQRFKEISIRKVLGASTQSIFMLLSKDYLYLLLIAFVCAIPICNYFASEWLGGFAYQVELGWYSYVLAIAFISVTALTAVGLQSLKAILANPADILKNE